MELINTLQPIALAIITALLAPPFIALFSGKKMKKINNAKAVLDVLGDQEAEHHFFLRNEIKEASFYQFTGITTNVVSIPLYLALKAQLGGDFSWNIISNAKKYLVIENDALKVKVSEPRRLLAGIGIISMYVIAICSITWMGYTYVNHPELRSIPLNTFTMLMIVPFLLTIGTVHFFRSERAAITIKMKLDEMERQRDNESQ